MYAFAVQHCGVLNTGSESVVNVSGVLLMVYDSLCCWFSCYS